MPIGEFAQHGTCVDPAHNSTYNSHIDGLEARILNLEVSMNGVPEIDPDKYSTLGQIVGGVTVAAGSVDPAIAGEVIPLPGATTWVKITGTASQAGDAVFLVYEGRRTALPSNPAARLTSAAGPGAAGTNTLLAGEIEISLSGSNTDLNRVFWFIQRKG